MKHAVLIGMAGIAVLALGAGAVARDAGSRGGWGQPQTRADAEAKVKAYFARVDANKDGKATKEEFASAREARREEFRDRAFDRIDSDNDGKISRDEFDANGANRRERRAEFRQRRGEIAGRFERGARGAGRGSAFARLDTDGNGSVTEAEMLGSLMARFDASDANKDGSVTREERRAAFEARLGEGAGQ